VIDAVRLPADKTPGWWDVLASLLEGSELYRLRR